MATYTGVADTNGDFTIPFSQNYTGGQKVAVKASKDGAEKTIELYAPSDLKGGGVIRFTGTLIDFPKNIGTIVLSNEINGAVGEFTFYAASGDYNLFSCATGLEFEGVVTSIARSAFYAWVKLKELVIPDSVKTISSSSFYGMTACKKLTLGSSLTSINDSAFYGLVNCDEIVLKPITPPSINSNSFLSLKSTCVIKVPSASLNAYKTATNWSTHASKMIGY